MVHWAQYARSHSSHPKQWIPFVQNKPSECTILTFFSAFSNVLGLMQILSYPEFFSLLIQTSDSLSGCKDTSCFANFSVLFSVAVPSLMAHLFQLSDMCVLNISFLTGRFANSKTVWVHSCSYYYLGKIPTEVTKHLAWIKIAKSASFLSYF